MEVTVRACADGDMLAVAAIYAEAVLHGTGTFELEPPSEAEMGARRASVLANGMPWLVAEAAGGGGTGGGDPAGAASSSHIVGYAYANHFRPRRAYRFCVEDSVYVAPHARGQGVGARLLTALIAACEAAGARQMLAVIGDSANAGSIALHTAHGFKRTGTLSNAGWKFGAWRDVVLMQRTLGPGSDLPADDEEARREARGATAAEGREADTRAETT